MAETFSAFLAHAKILVVIRYDPLIVDDLELRLRIARPEVIGHAVGVRILSQLDVVVGTHRGHR